MGCAEVTLAPRVTGGIRNVGRLTHSIMRYLFYLVVASLLLGGAIAFANGKIPEFTDYPARIIRTVNPVKVKIHSTPDTWCFRTMLRNTARHGDRFAGHYALSYWGCGTECARVGIVDLLTGRAYVSPYYVSVVGGRRNAIKTKSNSRLVLVNDPEVVGKDWGEPSPIWAKPSYFLWTGQHLLPIDNGRVVREPERFFKRCGEV